MVVDYWLAASLCSKGTSSSWDQWAGQVMFFPWWDTEEAPQTCQTFQTGLDLLSVTPTHIALAVAGHIYCCSVAQLCPTLCNLWNAARQAPLSFTIPQSLLKLMSVVSAVPSTILSFVVPFSCCLQSFPASGSFLMSQLFTSGGQRIGASTSASVLQINIQDWVPLGLTGVISLQSKGLSRVFNTTVQKASILQGSACFMVQLSHPYMTYWKNHSFD